MHLWIVFLHAFSVLVFVLAHGASHSVAFRIQTERRPERLCVLLELSTSTYTLMFGSLAALMALGVAAGFSGRWWSSGWIWTSLVVLLIVSTAMYMLGLRNYGPLRRALGLPISGAPPTVSSPASDDTVAALAAATRPLPGIIFGVGGLAVLMWLMLFKPF